MYSSLPSASKLYTSNVVKHKQKHVISNARRKRRKSKVLPSVDVLAETSTLVHEEQTTESKSIKYDSDATESTSEDVQSLSYPNDAISLKNNEVDENTNLQLIDEDTSEVESLVVLQTNESDTNAPENVIVTSAEVHSNDAVRSIVKDQSFESSDEDLTSKGNSYQLPVIIVSSGDSSDPNNTNAINDEPAFELISHSLSNTEVEDELNKEQYLTSSVQFQETVNEEQINKANNVQEEKEIHNSIVPDIIVSCSTSCQTVAPPVETTAGKATSHLTVETKLTAENIDDLSVKSDCCSSKNIYNEYSTETMDDSEHFMIDDSKPNSMENSSSSLSDSDDVEPDRIMSPGTSEVSGTESSIYDKKVMSEEKSHVICYKSITNVPKAALYVPPYVTNLNDMSCINSCENVIKQKPCIKESFLNRTQSLPENLNRKCLTTFTDKGEYYDDDEFKSHLSFMKVDHESNTEKQGNLGKQRSSVQLPNISEDTVPKSCESSTRSLSSISSESYRALPPVSVKEARLRSFVVGSVKAAGSLLGVDELLRYFPDKKVNIFVGTWNMNGQHAPECLNDFLLPHGVSYLSDIYAIGIQEGTQSRNDWEILMQTTIGPSHILLTSTSLGVLHLAIFIRRDLIWFCSEPEEAHVTTRPGSMVKTKGAVAISFTFFGTSLLFINSHLTAHERKLKERLADYEKICQMIDLPKKLPLKPQYQSKDATSRFDSVFWCGDLNFRVVQDRPAVVSFVEEKLKHTIETCEFLLQHDQLHKAMSEGMAFHGFQEGVITFTPSYKFDIGTCYFNSKKSRVPSYTDRVLYRSKRKGAICCLHYNVVADIMTSDHKPVFAIFEVAISPGRDNIPLAAGLFKRDVYLEACRRRAMALEVTAKLKNSSAICSIM